MAATVASRVALGLGVTPNVSPRCTGDVEGLSALFCAGMAAVKTDLGWGASITVGCLAGLKTGTLTLASIRTGLGSGNLGLGISILGAWSFTSGILGVSLTGGGGGSLNLI